MSEQNEERRERLRNLLLENKRKLWSELREEVFRSTGEDLNAQFDIPQDPGEQSLIDLLGDMNLSLADIRRQALTQMDEAMGRLESGDYGICNDCGREIDERRLAVTPYTIYCTECQKKREGPTYPPRATL